MTQWINDCDRLASHSQDPLLNVVAQETSTMDTIANATNRVDLTISTDPTINVLDTNNGTSPLANLSNRTTTAMISATRMVDLQETPMVSLPLKAHPKTNVIRTLVDLHHHLLRPHDSTITMVTISNIMAHLPEITGIETIGTAATITTLKMMQLINLSSTLAPLKTCPIKTETL